MIARAISGSDFLLDTNVLSEWVKPLPNPGVVQWLEVVDEDRTHISVVSFAEIRRGIERMEPGQRRQRLASWLDDELSARFEGRVFGIDRTVANSWSSITAQTERSGHTLSIMDAFLVATALVHNLTVVTRNVSDFRPTGVKLLNPW